jgi:hypothetical protein
MSFAVTHLVLGQHLLFRALSDFNRFVSEAQIFYHLSYGINEKKSPLQTIPCRDSPGFGRIFVT